MKNEVIIEVVEDESPTFSTIQFISAQDGTNQEPTEEPTEIPEFFRTRTL